MSMRRIPVFGGLIAMALMITACTVPADFSEPATSEPKLKVIATTTIVGDVVRQVGGDAIDLSVILPVGGDPHSYQATPGDLARVAEADVVFVNGVGLELFLDSLIENTAGQARVVSVSEGIPLRVFAGDHDRDDDNHGDEDDEDDHDHEYDPHVWFDPTLVKVWVENISTVLSELDGANASLYQENARKYTIELEILDQWITAEVAKIPAANRLLVMDHRVTGYFSNRYGFKEVGALIPAFSTLAEPSGRELAELVDVIADLNIKAIFVSEAVSPSLAERIAEDTGTQVVFIYHGSLSEADGAAATYLDFMRYNVAAITNALK